MISTHQFLAECKRLKKRISCQKSTAGEYVWGGANWFKNTTLFIDLVETGWYSLEKIFSAFSLDVLHLLCLRSVEFLASKWIYLLLRFCLKLNVANCTRVNSWSTQPETGRSLWEEQEREYSHVTVPLADSASGCQEHKPSQQKHFGAVFPAINLVGPCSAQLELCLERVTELSVT